ncbi:MAG: hypothetical protein EON60_02975 [Alphaproteobacteria bacterium]|nr:MAG: hypothetical protein EON60_02975 [Alphaproteobacteria bacterium]
MATRNVTQFEEQNSITAQSDDFAVNPAREISVVARLISGSPATGARVQVTLDELEKIIAGTATWVNSPLGNRTASGAEKILRPVTGVRLVVTDGTWGLQVRQA